MVISSDFNFLENDKIFLDLNKDTLELKCSLDIDRFIYSGSNEIINASSPDDFNYYYTLFVQTDRDNRTFSIPKVFVELTETSQSGIYSFNIKDLKKKLLSILQTISNDSNLITDFNVLIEKFKDLDTIIVGLYVFYIDKNLDLPNSEFLTNASYSNIDKNCFKREKIIIPSMDYKENVFYVSESNNFPYKYEISWDKIKLFNDFLVTIYCGEEKLLSFNTTEKKIDLFNFTVDSKKYNLKDLLGSRTDASNLKLEIKMIDSTISDIDTNYTFSYSSTESITTNNVSINAFNNIMPSSLVVKDYQYEESNERNTTGYLLSTGVSRTADTLIMTTTSSIATSMNNQYLISLKYRKFFPNQTYTFNFEIDWSKYTNNKLTHIHNKVTRSDSTLVFDITAQEYPFKVIYFFGNVDIIVIIRDILGFLFTFPWDVLKDIGVTLKDFLCCLNLDLNLNIGNTINKIIDILPELSQDLPALGQMMAKPGLWSATVKGEKYPSAWKDILDDCIDSCKKSSTSDHNTKKCNHSSETNTSCKERNCNLRNTLILLQEKIIQFNNVLPRITVGTYVFNNKDDKLGFDNLNNGTPYGLVTLSYSFILKAISGFTDDKAINSSLKKFKDDKEKAFGQELLLINNEISKYDSILTKIGQFIGANTILYKTTYEEYITAIAGGNSSTEATKKTELNALNLKRSALELELVKINTDISVLQKSKLDIGLKINDLNKNSTLDLVNYNKLNVQFTIDSPSANPNSYIIKFIDEKNVDTLKFTEEKHEACKPHSTNNLLHTFANKF